MKIIDIGKCINNIDPKGIGRIRFKRFNDFTSEKEKSLKYVEWDDRDPYLAIPFLPSNINMIPEIGQAVKIINYNPKKETVNQEYIAGPFNTMFDFGKITQSFSQQIEETTYGVSVKKRDDIRNKTGEYIEKNAELVFAKEEDYAIYGKYGSDILFTYNGLNLRSGKIISKEIASIKNKKKLTTTPIFTNKSAKLQLKKFPYTAKTKDAIELQKTLDAVNLKTLIEYEFDDIKNPTTIDFYVYKIISQYSTQDFNNDTFVDINYRKLINNDNSTSTPTYSVIATGYTQNQISYKIRSVITDVANKGLISVNTLYTDEDLHPIYFRPSEDLKLLSGTTAEMIIKDTILKNIKVKNISYPSSTLLFSKNNAVQQPKTNEVKTKDFYIDNNSPEQTFSSLVSDKIYLLSTDNEQNTTINFNDLDKYEYTQEDYIKKIDLNTYSLVRGEKLIQFLRKLVEVLQKHQHNVVGPYVKTSFDEHNDLDKLLNNIEIDIINKSIKIN